MVKSVVSSALSQAQLFAHDILNPPDEKAAAPDHTTEIHHHHYYWWWWGGSHCSTSSESSESSKSDKKEELPVVLIVCVAAVVVIVASYFAGVDAGKWSTINQETSFLKNRKIEVLQSDETGNVETANVLDFQEKILQSMKTTAKMNVVSKAALIGAAAIAGIGALAVSPATVLFGLGATACSSSAILFSWGFCSSDTSLKEKATDLLQMVDRVKLQVQLKDIVKSCVLTPERTQTI